MFKFVSVSGAPPQTLLVGASCLQQSQLRAFGACNFPYSHVYMRKTQKISPLPMQSPTPWHLQHLNFFTFKMSHYLKSLKICPGGRYGGEDKSGFVEEQWFKFGVKELWRDSKE